jgi:hypothetical protein
MGKASKKQRSDTRKEEKKRRKQANYLRYGPKSDQRGRRQKRSRYGTFTPKQWTEPHDASPTPPGVKARRRRKGLKIESKCSKGTKKHAKRPLRPLRKRERMSSAR